eukprot:3598980-Rhodomonas_salina.1
MYLGSQALLGFGVWGSPVLRSDMSIARRLMRVVKSGIPSFRIRFVMYGFRKGTPGTAESLLSTKASGTRARRWYWRISKMVLENPRLAPSGTRE